MMKSVLRCLCLILLVAGSLHAQMYTVRMSQPMHAGQKFKVSSSGKYSDWTSLSVGTSPARIEKNEFQVQFEGTAEVLAVDTKGMPYRISYTVEKLVKIQDGVATNLLKTGDMIFADGSQQVTFSLRGGILDEDTSDAFGVVVTTREPNEPTDDEVFGTPDLKSVGDKWPINSKLAVQDLKQDGINVEADQLSGTTTLISVDKVAGNECLNLKADLKATRVLPKTIPLNVQIDSDDLQAIMHGCYPTGSSFSHGEGTSISLQIRFRGPAGTPLEGAVIETKIAEEMEALWTSMEK